MTGVSVVQWALVSCSRHLPLKGTDRVGMTVSARHSRLRSGRAVLALADYSLSKFNGTKLHRACFLSMTFAF